MRMVVHQPRRDIWQKPSAQSLLNINHTLSQNRQITEGFKSLSFKVTDHFLAEMPFDWMIKPQSCEGRTVFGLWWISHLKNIAPKYPITVRKEQNKSL